MLLRLTITNEGNPSAVPRVEQLLFQHDLGDQVLGCVVNQVAERHVVSRHREILDMLAHCVSRLWSPLCVTEGIALLAGLFVQLLKYHPANRVGLCREGDPLNWEER